MIINNKLKITRVYNKIRKGVQLIYLENGKPLSSLLDTVGWQLITVIQESSKKAKNRIRMLHNFHQYLEVMTKRYGVEHTVSYLKHSALILSRFLAGNPVHSYRELDPNSFSPRLRSCGLPTYIGSEDIKSLKSGGTKTIRLWLTLFSLYRVIYIPGKAKLNTITDPFSGDPQFLEHLNRWMERNASKRLECYRMKINLYKQKQYPFLESASPSNSVSWTGMMTDLALLKSSAISGSFLFVANNLLATDLLMYFKKLWDIAPTIDDCRFKSLPMKDSLRKFSFEDNPMLGLGQLFQKTEPAGKVRTFALVDSWTQTVLSPLHSYLDDLLKQIPNDGTRSHLEAFDRVRIRSQEYGCAYGYDLSAATDRLPLSLQISLLGGMVGMDFARHWANLLVGRPYYLYDKKDLQAFTYAIGQPMGARSSFTMLGLTHHMLVQYASPYLGTKWEDRYEIVGDDIVIFDKTLAENYLQIMSKIGVPINLSKSVVAESKPVAEYVKRVSYYGKDVSPLSWKQFYVQSTTVLGRLSTTIGLFMKDKTLLDRAIAVYETVLRSYPGQKLRDLSHIVSIGVVYAVKCKMPLEDIIKLLVSFNPEVKDKKLVWNINKIKLSSIIKNLINGTLPELEKEKNSLHYEIMGRVNAYYQTLMERLNKKYNRVIYKQEFHILHTIMDKFPIMTIAPSELDALYYFIWYSNPIYSYNVAYCDPQVGPYGAICPVTGPKWPMINSFTTSLELYEDVIKRISFITLPDRVKDHRELPNVLENREVQLLRILEKILKDALSHSNGQ
jgi:hypothetical protein